MRNPYSASQLGRRYMCPGSAKAEAGLPEVESPEASSGTRIHHYVSIQDDLRHTVELSEDERSVAEEWFKFRDSFHIDDRWKLEEDMILLDEDGSEITTGTVDAVAENTPDTVVVIDLKTGYQPIPEIVAVFQLSVYLAMAIQHYGSREGVAYIFQPRVGRKYQCFLNATDVSGVITLVKNVIADCESDTLKLSPSAEACRDCRALHSCPGPRSLGHPLVAQEDLTRLPAERMAELWDMWKVVKKQGEALDKLFRKEVREGHVPGYEMIQRRGNRYFPSTRNVFNRVKETIPAQEFVEICTVSPAKLEKAYVEKVAGNGIVTKAAASREFADLTQNVTERGKPKELITKKEDE